SPFEQMNGAIVERITTQDLLLGSQSTSSAKFGFLNVGSGTPTASISGASNNALSLTATGTITTTNAQTLTLGGTSTGNILLDSGSDLITLADNTLISQNLTVAGTTGVTLSGTGADLIFANGERITNDTDGTFTFGRNDAGTVTLTASDDDTVADFTIQPGSTGILNLTSTNTGAGAVAISSTGVGGGISLNANTAITLDSSSLSIDVTGATGANNISVASDNDTEDLTIETTGTLGDLLLNSADELVLTANGADLTLVSDFNTGVNIGS